MNGLVISKVTVTSALTLDEAQKSFRVGHTEKLSAGMTNIGFDGMIKNEAVHCSAVFGADGHLKVIMMWADYRRFMAHPEFFCSWDDTRSFDDDIQALVKWLDEMTGLADDTEYSWGTVRCEGERYSRRAAARFIFRPQEN